MAIPRPPVRLGPRGRKLWREINAQHDIDVLQAAVLVEACRIADRLDQLHVQICEADDEGRPALLSQANGQASMLQKLLTALRLPDPVTGKRPQRRSARGAYGGGRRRKPTALELARLARDRPPR